MRILIVDDDYVSRVKLTKLLSDLGHCDNAPNGDIAIRMFESAHGESIPYDLVTMDIEMFDMNGKVVVTRLREMENSWQVDPNSAAKILMVTATTAVKEVFSSYNEGCDDYLTKPIKPDDLIHALTRIGIKH